MSKVGQSERSIETMRKERKAGRRDLSMPERLAELTSLVPPEQRAGEPPKRPSGATERQLGAKTVKAAETAARPARVLRPAPKALRSSRIVAPFSDRPEAEVFKMLRTQVLKRMKQRAGRALGICSARDAEGKSFVALNLAISLAQSEDLTTVLVELDLRRPSLLRSLGVGVEKGIEDVLAGDASIDDCLFDPGYGRLVVLPARGAKEKISDRAFTSKVPAMLEDIRRRYPDGLVVYDLPPLLLSDVSIGFMPHLDGCLLVVEEGRTKKSEIEHALELIDENLLIGTVLNKAGNIGRRDYKY